MFRQLAGTLPGGANAVFLLHPADLAVWLEEVWAARPLGAFPLGDPRHRSNIPALHPSWLAPLLAARGLPAPPPGFGGFLPIRLPGPIWDHLIYAYMIENTRIYEVFRRVLYEMLHGEKLGAPTPAAQHWLRTTEELFYRDPPSFSIRAITSDIRTDLRASRRNAYQRMFAMDLNHGTDDGKPYSYQRADAANTEFVNTFEELLREVWTAITNITTTSGPNPTDAQKMADLVTRLHDMLRSRRQYGNLSREEFVFVSTMSWFHLTVEFDSPVVVSLRAEAQGTEQRLFKIAERVGLPAHGLSKNYFDIADAISRILILIETGALNNVAAVPVLFSGAARPTMQTIITNWSTITGRDMKAGRLVGAVPAAPSAARLVSGNGAGTGALAAVGAASGSKAIS